MAVIILQCSLSLSDRPHPLHLHLSTFPPISPLSICTLSSYVSSLPNCFFFSPNLLFPLYFFHFLQLPLFIPHPSSPAADNTLPSFLSALAGLMAADSNRPHLIIIAHALYSIPSSVSDYNRVHGPTYQLNTKARNVKGVATRCQPTSSARATCKHSQRIYYL